MTRGIWLEKLRSGVWCANEIRMMTPTAPRHELLSIGRCLRQDHDSSPSPRATTPTNRSPALYPQRLTPIPLCLRPHCLAKDRLRSWTPATPRSTGGPRISDAEYERVKDTMLHIWEEETCVYYGAGLLMWHCFFATRERRAPSREGLRQRRLCCQCSSRTWPLRTREGQSRAT